MYICVGIFAASTSICRSTFLFLLRTNASKSDHVHTHSCRFGHKHKGRLLKLSRATDEGKKLTVDLADYFDRNPGEHMASLPTHVHVFRYSVTEAFLASATPLERLSFFKALLEAGGQASLTDHSHMREYIPKIESRELGKVKEEMRENDFFSISFDGTSRLLARPSMSSVAFARSHSVANSPTSLPYDQSAHESSAARNHYITDPMR